MHADPVAVEYFLADHVGAEYLLADPVAACTSLPGLKEERRGEKGCAVVLSAIRYIVIGLIDRNKQ